MSYLLSNCRLTSLQDIQVQSNLSFFSCGDKDLDEFFQCDATAYEYALFGKTYAFIDKRNNITSMFTISNGGIQAKQMRRKLRENVPYPKRLIHNYPSVLIGRLAVSNPLLALALFVCDVNGMQYRCSLIVIPRNT